MRFFKALFLKCVIRVKKFVPLVNEEKIFWRYLKIVYLLPLILSLSIPFASWDYLNVPDYQLQGDAFSFSRILPNLANSLFIDRVQFRPVSSIFGNLQYALFGGEFWIWYLIRWLTFWLMLKNFYRVLIKLNFSKPIALSSISIMALTATPIVLDLFNQDFLVIFMASIYLRFLVGSEETSYKFIDKKSWPLVKEITLGILWLLTLFSKEIGLIVAIWLIFARNIISPRTKRVNQFNYFFYSIFLVFTLFRLLQINHPSITGSLISTNTLIATFKNIQGIFGYLVPYSWANLCLILFISIMLLGGINFILRSEWKLRTFRFYMISVVGLLSCGFFFARNVALCPRYMAVPLMFSIFIIANSFDAIERRRRNSSKKIALVLILSFALLSPPKIYSGWFGMQQTLYNVNNDVNFIYRSLMSGKDVKWSGSLPVELSETTLQNFLNNFGRSSYGVKEFSGTYGSLDFLNIPKSPFIVWTTEPLEEFRLKISESLGEKEATSLKSRLRSAHISEVDNFGFFQNVVRKLKRVDHLIGSPLKDPIYCQQPIPSCFGFDFPNPDFNRQPWFVYQYGPYYFYEFSDANETGPLNSLKVIRIPNFLRYGSLFR